MNKITINKNISFYEEAEAFSGVKKIAELVKDDFNLVFDKRPDTITNLEAPGSNPVIIYGTLGKSPILEKLASQNLINLEPLKNKWEVYSITVLENMLVVAGSDKRGTIYGLFHLSEMIGVSPLVNWNHVYPAKKNEITFSSQDNIISKEPSVKYRGFFINDEWPAFGTWAKNHFGGINAKCYQQVFELLLRLKGNYLWPAMWDSNFELDGPGLASADLADELGVVMSMSHHEPCMRSGQEYSMVRGKNSEYGDAWDFIANPKGITKFWRDGLVRTADKEQVITMGMRGENDSAIMQNATLEENIQLIRNVLKTQNQLIRETINPDLSKVRRQIVLFTEVEEFFYGNQQTKGLIGDPELDGITLMLSDNNVGYTRTLPTKEMLKHNGGYGMYYHMDMHGGPHAFQWIGSSYLPKIQDQMTTAYDYGVREIWVTNIGDIGTQEFGLSYFLDLAYDIDKWGHATVSQSIAYRKNWIEKQFATWFAGSTESKGTDLYILDKILDDYTTLLAKRKHEVMNASVFHPVHFGEAQKILDTCNFILENCEALKSKCPENFMSAFVSLLYYPACGTANLFKMWILASRNKLYADQNRVEANLLADELPSYLQRDLELIEEYHKVDNGKYDGFGLGEHIGFTFWNDEDCKYPQQVYITPAREPRMILVRSDKTDYLVGGTWRDRQPQIWKDFLRPDVNEINFEIACASEQEVKFKIDTECDWMSFSSVEGTVGRTNGTKGTDLCKKITLKIDRSKIQDDAEGLFTVENVGFSKAKIILKVHNLSNADEKNAFIETDGIISMMASHFQENHSADGAEFKTLEPYGRTGSSIKVYPVTANFENCANGDRPYVTYNFTATESTSYEMILYMSPTTPVCFESKHYIGYSINDEKMICVNTVHQPDRPFFLSRQWEEEAISNIKIVKETVNLKKGLNTLKLYAVSPQIMIEKIVLHKTTVPLPESYLGPKESFIC